MLLRLRAIALAGLLALVPFAVRAQQILPQAFTQFSNGNGAPYAGGSVYFYIPGTSTPKTTWSDSALANPNPNPVVLDGNGRASIWGTGSYREVLKDSSGNQVWDAVTSVSTPSSGPATVLSGGTGTSALTQNALVVGNGTNPVGTLPPGTAGQVLTSQANGTWAPQAPVTPQVNPASVRGFIDGFETGAPGGSETLTIGPGSATDNTNAYMLTVGGNFNKTMQAWAVGSGNGCLDTGTVASNTAYFLYLIENLSNSVIDYLCSVQNNSSGTPTLPSNYTVVRGPISWFETDSSSNIWKFQQRGDEFLFGAGVEDVAGSSIGTGARTLKALSVPNGYQVDALIRTAASGSITANSMAVLYTSPDESDQATGVAGPTDESFTVDTAASTSTVYVNATLRVRTNTSQQIGIRAATQAATVYVFTYGFVWTRGRNS